MSEPNACIEIIEMVADFWNTRSIDERQGIAISLSPSYYWIPKQPFQILPLKIQTEIVEYWANR